MDWPDIVIAAILLLAALKGYKRGFIMELAGFFAVVLAFITPWFYRGTWDAPLAHAVRVSTGTAHVIAMVLIGIATYACVLLIARALTTVAKLPILGLGNALAGGAVGLLKGIVAVWLILYIALFFPLGAPLRSDLHRSALAAVITLPNVYVDDAVSARLPGFARALLVPVFARHHV